MLELKKYYRAVPLFGYDYKIEEIEAYGPPCNGFLSGKEAKADFLEAQKLALSKHNQILKGLESLRKKLDVDFRFDYFMAGDTYGIDECGYYIGLSVNTYDFKFVQDGRILPPEMPRRR